MNAQGEDTTRIVHPSAAAGSVTVPSSKSHTIRALLLAACAAEPSLVRNVLDSADARSCIAALRLLGVSISEQQRSATGMDLAITPPPGGITAADHGCPLIDVGNSGTTLYLMTALAAVIPGGLRFDGDASIRRRAATPLLDALAALGAVVDGGDDHTGCSGCAPYRVRGPLQPGRSVAVESPTSQYLSALLLATPLIPAQGEAAPETVLDVRLLYEEPYVDMTCWWLDAQRIRYTREGYRRFTVAGAQQYRAVNRSLPGDYSSATFWFAAAAVTGGSLRVRGLDPDDVQGDRGVLTILEQLGCTVQWDPEGVSVSGPLQRGGSFDLNAMPDALPALAVVGACAPEPVELHNVAQARSKETDRISVMCSQLARCGARISELPDGLRLEPSQLTGAVVHSHADHRVAMALAIAALVADGPTSIRDAGAAAVTYPAFFDDLARLAPQALR